MRLTDFGVTAAVRDAFDSRDAPVSVDYGDGLAGWRRSVPVCCRNLALPRYSDREVQHEPQVDAHLPCTINMNLGEGESLKYCLSCAARLFGY